MAPETVPELLGWLLTGAILVCAAGCNLFLSLLLKKMDKICDTLEQYGIKTTENSLEIVRIQTRCAINHKMPFENMP